MLADKGARVVLTVDRAVRRAVVARGHALVTGPPGIGKTSLASTLAASLGGMFKRLQFTPDLLPSDIIGYNLYRQQKGDFDFIPGPVFSNLLLADEINRASPRTQSALLESMNERQVSIDGETKKLPDPFLVVATQNDTSSTGTFPLPEPQLDRFLLSIPMSLPSEECQLAILKMHGEGPAMQQDPQRVLPMDELAAIQSRVAEVSISDTLQRYLLALCQAARSLTGQDHAISVRGSLALQSASRAYALLEGHDAVHPDHVQAVYPHVFRHRLLTDDTLEPDPLLDAALQQTPVP